MVDTKKPPYFSTFDEVKKYYRILARPGRPIQVREWNDLQDQIQKQIERVGAHLFENGAQVLPGTEDAVTYRNNVGFIKLSSVSSANLNEAAIKNLFLGKTLVSTSSPVGVKAKVIGYRTLDTLQEVRLFVDYVQADSDTGNALAFIAGQSVQTEETTPTVVNLSNTPTSIGTVSGVFVQNSVYFFNGDFILVDEQSLILDPSDPTVQDSWNNKPTAKVGLSVKRSIVTFQEDETLGDNASLSENFGAPGADRLQIEAILEQKSYNAENDGQFIELVRVADGEVQERVRSTAYSVIENTLARRTFDESGDYSVRDFPLTVRAFLKEGENGGAHSRSEYQYDTQAAAEAAGLKIFGVQGACVDPEAPSKWLPASSAEEFLRLARGKLTLQIDPGKAYVKGYEIEKLAPSYVDIDKARQLRFQNNRLVNANLGTFVYITNIYGPPEIESYEKIEIHRKRKSSLSDLTPNDRIGTARVLAVEHFSGTHGDPDAVYRLYLFDVNADAGKTLSQMKSVASTSGLSFSADLALEFSPLEGSVTTEGIASTTLTGNGTSFVNKPSQKIAASDYLRIGNNNSQVVQVASISNDISLTLSSSVTIAGNQSVEIAYASFHGLEDAKGLIFNLPEKYAYAIRSADSNNVINDTIDTVFSVRKQFTAQSNNLGVITINVDSPAEEEFVPYSPNDYILVNTTQNGDWIRLASGTSYNAGLSTAGVEIVSTSQVKIYANPAHQNNTFYIIASVKKIGGTASQEKSKTVVSTSITTDANKNDLTEVSLGQADILRIKRVVMSPDFSVAPSSAVVLPSGHSDISDRYLLDNGQRDYYYGIGSIYLKPGAARPTGRLRIEFDYFTHSGQGSYFSVDSYPFKGATISMDYADIPNFTDSSGRLVSLRDCIDFRPRLSTAGTFENYIAVPRSDIRLDFHHYLNRTDNLYLDKLGVFRVTKGIPDTVPVEPEEPGDGMSLYKLDLQAYTASPAECFKRKMDNRRYTMRDIGKLERRVSNLEYYTVLSLLEKEAKELDIKDAQGLDRFKNGFIVDNFTSHGIGNIADSDYRCSVDIQNQELRPSHPQNVVDMIELHQLQPSSVVRDQKRSENNYIRTGKLFTLKYTPKKFIEQDLASQVENINPYAKFTFRGRIKLDPSTDSWRDTQKLPDLEVFDETAYLAAKAGVNPNQVIWGEWERFTKVDVDKKKVNNLVKRGPNKPDAVHRNNWPKYVEKGHIITTTTTNTDIRKGIKESVVPGGYQTQSLGKRIVATITADYMRTREVKVEAAGFMPLATLHAFFDNQLVNQFCNPNNLGYGAEIKADATGSVNLVFKIPAGRFLTGERIFKLTVSPTNSQNPQPASEGESKYYAVGWIDQVEETQLSIRQFQVAQTEVSDQKVDVDVDVEKRTKIVKEDPIAQSFTVTEKGGCFLLAVDVFFYTKDANVPVKLQVRPLSDDGYPTIFIMPFGEVVKPAADVVTNDFNPSNGTLTVTGNGVVQGYTVGPWNNSTSNPNLIERVTNASGTAVSNGAAFQSNEPLKDMIPTRFVFDSPIYLAEGSDYAIVLIADSVNYQTWVSQAGPITPRPGGVPLFGSNVNTKLGTNVPILSDNYLGGVFFRSSNGTTWNADQNVDMKFALHKAEFVTNSTAVIEYVNDELPVRSLSADPIQTFSGSTKIRVNHPNHGHPAFASPPARVVISGVPSGLANGINTTLLNRAAGWPIESVELDSYVIDITGTGSTAATSSGRCGGSAVVASENRALDTMFFNTNVLSFKETNVDWTYSSTNGGNVSFLDPNPRATPFVINPYKELQTNTTISFSNPMTVSSKINENNFNDVSAPGPSKVNTNGVGDRKSLRMKAVLRSTNPNLSPVLDADRLSVISVSNRINNPVGSGTNSINTALDTIQIVPNTQVPATANLIYFYTDSSGVNKGRLKTDNADVGQQLSNLDVGKLVTITGAVGANRNVTDALITEVTYTPGQTPVCSIVLDTTFGGSAGVDSGTVNISQKDRFVDEIAPQGGSAAFKYITKQLSLVRQSTALRISFDANRNESHDLEVYYRILRADSNVALEDINWTKAAFNIDNNGSLVAAYPTPNSFDDEMSEYSSTIENLPPFIGVSVKIVGKGGNSALPPRISNLKVIAIDE